MAVIVSFFKPSGIGSAGAPTIGGCRVMESITVPGTTTATVQDGELVVIGNGESSMVLAAHGTTPDAQATAETSATTAGYPVGAGQLFPTAPKVGDKINIKALP